MVLIRLMGVLALLGTFGLDYMAYGRVVTMWTLLFTPV